ncbi:response regulator transcription factor [Trinickia dabaoshanensis]|uniref:response regulator transcription factor n=1 Tax=Trinickia dabaoshanensis TaxID=564714 RepID=UPI0013047C91|nr:response regulator transcription factor [Trinickia dabaoshanensis]
MRFALVTDDPQLATNLSDCFAEDGIAIEPFEAELPLFRAMRTKAFDAVLIDAKDNSMLVNSLLSWQNCNGATSLPVIVLTPFSNSAAMLRWITSGATDVANRFDLQQVRLRAHIAARRRAPESQDDVVSSGRYVLRRHEGTLTIDGEQIPLTPREFAMAWLLFSNAGKFLSRAQIASSVWGACEDIAGRSIEQHIYKLRKKLQLSGQGGANLKTVYALGYKLDLASAEGFTPEPLQWDAPRSRTAPAKPRSYGVSFAVAPAQG